LPLNLRMAPRQSLTKEQVLQKLRHYCAYQERCHSEVVDKLFSLGVKKSDHDALLAAMIEENYLNEERFALSYAGGKFRIRNWGRNRIKYELKKRQISDYCIRKALKEIDEESYHEVLARLAADKYADLKKEQWLVRRKKTQDFLVAKGFEQDLVREAVSRLGKG